MKKALKWIGVIVVAVVAVLVVAGIGLTIYGNSQFKPTYADRPLAPITADTSPEGLARGEYLMTAAMACTDACHRAEDGTLSGTVEEISDGPIAFTFAPPNLTTDQRTGLGSWTDAEIARAIREGVDKDGIGLVIMPSYTFHELSDADVAAIVGYLRNMRSVEKEIPPVDGNMVAKIMNAFGAFGASPVGEPITAVQTSPKQGTADYGNYLIGIGGCRDCHQPNLAGGTLPFADPNTPPAANLTPAGDLATWSDADFLTAMRNGLRPDGSIIDPVNMPWPNYGKMTEADLLDILAYLRSVPPATE